MCTKGTTLIVTQQCIIINLEKIEDDVFNDSDKQTVVFLTSYLSGMNINHSARTITLFLSLKGNYSFYIDFERGGIDSIIAEMNFQSANTQLASIIMK